MEPKVKNVSLQLKLSNGIKIIGNKTQTLQFEKPDEQMAYFELDVSDANGIQTVEVIATGHGERSTYEVELDVFNPNPISTKVTDFVLNANENQTIDFSTFGVNGSNSAQVEFSTLPPMNFSERLSYLIQYPHGCVEQTTSSVFPQLYLTDIFDLTFDKKKAIEENIKLGIKKLGYFQTPSGGLSYWSGQSTPNDWGTSYAGHFMIEAEKKGYVLPLAFMSNWLRYQKDAAKKWRPSYRTYRSDVAQAYRLYTLALAGQPDLASMNRLKTFDELSNDAKWRLAAAYALAGQKEAATTIIKTANISFTSERYDYYTYGSIDRNRAMALETMVLLDDSNTRQTVEYIAKRLSSDQWMSTQTTAYSLMAMAKMVTKNGGKALQLNYELNDNASQSIDTQSAIALRDLDINDGNNQLHINSIKNNTVYVHIITSGKLPLGKEIPVKRGLSASINYKDSQGNSIDVTKLQQGQDFIASITVSNLKDEAINDIALTELFPSGWEIINTRFTDFGNATTTNAADYTDVRDDRVNFYFDLSKNGANGSQKTFTVLLNAAYLGTYYLPGAQVEAMYDNDYFVRTRGKWVTIEK